MGVPVSATIRTWCSVHRELQCAETYLVMQTVGSIYAFDGKVNDNEVIMQLYDKESAWFVVETFIRLGLGFSVDWSKGKENG